jgi:CHAD domain-containing protein
MKHWRALLRLLEPILGSDGRKLRFEARDLARELAGPRDAQSALDALQDIVDANPSGNVPSPQSIKAIADRLKKHRNRMQAARLNGKLRARLVHSLDTAAASVDRWPVKQATFAEILELLTAMYRRARRALPKDWSGASPPDLHKLRQRVVDHRYQMELFKALWPRMGRAWIREAQKLRTQLGKFQDLAVLARLAEAGQPLAPWRSRLLPAITQRQADLVDAAKQTASRLFAESPKAFRRHFEALWVSTGGKLAGQ